MLDLGPATLVGVSQGAGIALAVALDHPQLVSCLVLAGPGAMGWPEWSVETTEKDRRVDQALAAADRDAALPRILDLWAPPGRFPDTDQRVRALLEDNLETWFVDEDWERWPDRPRLERLGEFRVPTLVVLAEHDVPEILATGHHLAGRIAGAKLAAIPAADHMVNVRNPEAFTGAVAAFLSRS